MKTLSERRLELSGEKPVFKSEMRDIPVLLATKSIYLQGFDDGVIVIKEHLEILINDIKKLRDTKVVLVGAEADE